MINLDKIKNPRLGLQKQEKVSRLNAYKDGINTKLDSKHLREFGDRFLEKNAEVLKEVWEEKERIDRKRKGIYLNKLRVLGIIK